MSAHLSGQGEYERARLAIADALKLDVDLPDETEIMPDGKPLKRRDDIGLSLDPLLYASRNCDCRGRGTYVRRVQVSVETALKMVAANPANEALFDRDVKKKDDRDVVRYYQRVIHPCGCSRTGYEKKRELFGKALVKAGLVERLVTNDDGKVFYVLKKDV